jgi:hypothetical protein
MESCTVCASPGVIKLSLQHCGGFCIRVWEIAPKNSSTRLRFAINLKVSINQPLKVGLTHRHRNLVCPGITPGVKSSSISYKVQEIPQKSRKL